jgi:uncharacterized protein GlcG (DUF336 family)
MTKQNRCFRAGLVAVTATCALTALPGYARAQGDQKLPLAKAVQTGEDAKRALTNSRISADVAQKIVNACVDAARAVNGSVSVFVLSNDGEIAAAHRMDGQNTVNTQTGLRKAQTALHMGESTHAAANRFATLDAKIIRQDMDFYLVAGGLPIVVDDVMIGSIGVGGGRNINDEQCAYQALTKVLGPQPPLAPNQPANPLGNAAPAGGGAGDGGGRGAGGRGGRGGN